MNKNNDFLVIEDDKLPPPKRPLTFNDYFWITAITIIVLAFLPLLAIFGLFFQSAFVVLIPIIIIGTIGHAIYERVKEKHNKK